MTHLTFSVQDQIATIVLDNPPQNRIDLQMADELSEAITAIGSSDARVVIIRAEGADFSFGGDIMTWPGAETRELRALFERYMSVFNQLELLPMPVIAEVHGLCFGGGFELALRADLIFAAESAEFGHPEQTLGIVTLLGGIYRVAERAGKTRAAEWAMTSEKVSASEMNRAGVVNRVVSEDKLTEEVLAFAQRIATGATQAYAAHKALLRTWSLGGVAAADQAMFDIAMPLFEREDTQAGLKSAVAALEAGRPRPVLEFQGR